MISHLKVVKHPKLQGVQIFPVSSIGAGKAQTVLVTMDPGATIPAHTHQSDAEMFPVSGSASLIAADPEFNGQIVMRGQRVYFARDGLHGFAAGGEGFSFLSVNDGIVDEDPRNWDIQF